jgi:ferric-dicitrate binding protein FerR (iron transport regulator)
MDTSAKGDTHMSIDHIEDRILAQLDGDLTPDEEKALFEELGRNPDHAALYEEYRRQERRLETYYTEQATHIAEKARPELVSRPTARRGASIIDMTPSQRVQALVAASVLLAATLGGVGIWRGQMAARDFGSVLALSGPAQSIGGGGGVADLSQLERLDSQIRRLKTGTRGYLEVALPADSGSFEMNSNTAVRLHKEGLRGSTLEIERGEVIVQIADGSASTRTQLKTQELEVRNAEGSVSVVRGLRGTEVAVLSGRADVVQGSVRRTLKAGDSFSSLGIAPVANPERLSWSRTQGDTMTAIPTHSNSGGTTTAVPSTQFSPEKFLPAKTFAYIDVPSIARLINPLGAETPADLLQQRAFLDDIFSRTEIRAEDRQQVEALILKIAEHEDVRTVLEGLTGSAVIGFTLNGPIVIAELGDKAPSVDASLQHLIDEFGGGATAVNSELPMKIIGTKLVLGMPGTDFEESAFALESNTPTLFSTSMFLNEVQASTAGSAVAAAFSVQSLIAQASPGQEPGFGRAMTRFGFANMKTVVAATDFGDQAGNQAIRVTFDGERQGVMSWLDEPGSMGSLRYYSPDTHALSVLKIREPQAMLGQLFTWLGEDQPNFQAPDTAEEKAIATKLAKSLGNEIAIGLDNPVLPVPNVKIAIEVLDPEGFHTNMVELLDLMWQSTSPANQVTAETATYRDHLIVDVKYPGAPFGVSYAIIDDYVVFGPGRPFLERTIDSVTDGRSIDREYAFTSSLPASSGTHVSALFYFAADKKFMDAMQSLGSNVMDPQLRAFLQSSANNGQGMVAYAVASDTAIDFFLEGVRIGDYRLAGAIPVVAEWLGKKH